MMDQNKPTPPLDLSVKYMAWNIKQMDVNIKRIADSLEMIVQEMKSRDRKSPAYVQGEIPF
jgi:hypothetical protein